MPCILHLLLLLLLQPLLICTACALHGTGQCSVYGFCLGSATSTPRTAPAIDLRITAAAPASTSIKQGYSYTACLPGQQPYKGVECELGATAQDAQAGNLTSSVLVCAPAACTAPACTSGGLPRLLPCAVAFVFSCTILCHCLIMLQPVVPHSVGPCSLTSDTSLCYDCMKQLKLGIVFSQWLADLYVNPKQCFWQVSTCAYLLLSHHASWSMHSWMST